MHSHILGNLQINIEFLNSVTIRRENLFTTELCDMLYSSYFVQSTSKTFKLMTQKNKTKLHK